MTDQDLIAAFLAKNEVTKCPEGARAYSDKQMYSAERGATKSDLHPKDEGIRLSTVDHLGREIWVNAEGEFHSYG